MTRLLSALDDAELIRRARTEREAFGELYRRYRDVIGTYLCRRTGCRHAAADLLSEVFLAAMAALPRYRDRGLPYRHYLYRVATRAANRWANRARRQIDTLDFDALVDPASEADERPERALAAMLRLKTKHQEVLSLRYVEGLSVDEIAQVLRIRAGTVKSRLKRARDLLRARLERTS